MKTNENIRVARKQLTSETAPQSSSRKGVILAAFLLLVMLPMNVMAARERYVLDFSDSQIRSHRGDPATLFLGKSLRQQYPRANIANMDLRKVVLVAKSRKGRGCALLRVGNWTTPLYAVAGDPSSFRNQNRHSFDRVKFRNPSRSSRGPWQVDLHGNFIVRKVVLEVEEHRRPQYGYQWRHHNW